MKKLIYFSLMVFFVCVSMAVLADGPGAPPPPGDPGAEGGPVGAPIDGGLGILFILAGSLVYGGSKYYRAWKIKKNGVDEKNV